MTDNNDRTNMFWSDDEKNYLYDVWGELTISAIAKHLNRSKGSVISFAQKNGLGGFLYGGTYLTTGQASELIGVDSTTVISWIKKDILKATFKKIHKKKVYLIDPEVFKTFLKDNQDKWNYFKLKNDIFYNDEEWLLEKKLKDSENVFFKTGESWSTKEELKMIELINEGYTNTQISEILSRTKESIGRKRTSLLASGKINYCESNIQDKIHKNFILENWGKLSLEELAVKTGKTVEQVSAYKWKYKLPSLYALDDNTFTYIELAKILGISRATVGCWSRKFGLKSYENSKGNKKRLVVNIYDVMPFLEINKDKLSSGTYDKCKFALDKYFNNIGKEAI